MYAFILHVRSITGHLLARQHPGPFPLSAAGEGRQTKNGEAGRHRCCGALPPFGYLLRTLLVDKYIFFSFFNCHLIVIHCSRPHFTAAGQRVGDRWLFLMHSKKSLFASGDAGMQAWSSSVELARMRRRTPKWKTRILSTLLHAHIFRFPLLAKAGEIF